MTRWVVLQWAAVVGMVLVATWAQGATVEIRLDNPNGELLLSAAMDAKVGTNTMDLRGFAFNVEAGQMLALVLRSEEELRWSGLGPLYYTNGDPWRRVLGLWESITEDFDLLATHCVKPENDEQCGLGDVGFPGLYAPPNHFPRVGPGRDMAQVFEVTETGQLDTVSVHLGQVETVPAGAGWVLVTVGLGVLGLRRKRS